MNSATKLTLLLTDEERMSLQRIALNTPSAGIMTLEEVSSLLNIDGVRGSSCNGGSKGPADAVKTIGKAGAKHAARLLAFCRTAAISENIMICCLGKTTARMQANALLKRVLVAETHDLPDNLDPEEYLHLVPEHAKNLCACALCKRVSNAAACDNCHQWMQTFNEIGTRSSMISVDPQTKKTHLQCARRSSASIRTAMVLEEEADKRAVDVDTIDLHALHSVLKNNQLGSDTGTAARVRRDSKTTMQQRVSSVTCGSEHMLLIPIVGKAVRIWNEWYALCSYCGCFVRFHSNNRMGVEICCMRCDYRMLHRKEKQMVNAKDAARAITPKCRFCGKEDPQRMGAKWKLVRSPLDTSGANASLPSSLRSVFFCPQHFRSWIPMCLKSMPTRVILSHIVYGAKPCYGSSPDANTEAPNCARSSAVTKKRRKMKI